jgi:hypothetical protein
MLTISLFGTDTGEYGMTERVLQELSFWFPANLLDGPPHLLLLLRLSIGWSTLYIPDSYVRRGIAGEQRTGHIAIRRGTLTNRLMDLIHEGKLIPTGEWVLPSQQGPVSGKTTQSKLRNGENS